MLYEVITAQPATGKLVQSSLRIQLQQAEHLTDTGFELPPLLMIQLLLQPAQRLEVGFAGIPGDQQRLLVICLQQGADPGQPVGHVIENALPRALGRVLLESSYFQILQMAAPAVIQLQFTGNDLEQGRSYNFV